MDSVDLANDAADRAALGPEAAIPLPTIATHHIAACRNLQAECDRCQDICGLSITHAKLKAMQRRIEKLMDKQQGVSVGCR
jgi:hypothetical protein